MANMEEKAETNTKEDRPSSIKFSTLTSTNYTVWVMRMKIAIKVNKVWKPIDPQSKHEEKNNMAIPLLFQSIPEALIQQVGEFDTAKEYGMQSKEDMTELREYEKRVCKH